jgi:hypothetical protein
MAADNDQVTIDWSTATVTVTGEDLELEVDLESEPSHFWTKAFNNLRTPATQQGAPREDWWVNPPSYQRLTVGGVKPGSEQEVQKGLDEMVDAANRQTPLDRKADEDKQRALEEEARARESAAGEMTERFRSPPI